MPRMRALTEIINMWKLHFQMEMVRKGPNSFYQHVEIKGEIILCTIGWRNGRHIVEACHLILPWLWNTHQNVIRMRTNMYLLYKYIRIVGLFWLQVHVF